MAESMADFLKPHLDLNTRISWQTAETLGPKEIPRPILGFPFSHRANDSRASRPIDQQVN